jgi:hypothetical protein
MVALGWRYLVMLGWRYLVVLGWQYLDALAGRYIVVLGWNLYLVVRGWQYVVALGWRYVVVLGWMFLVTLIRCSWIGPAEGAYVHVYKWVQIIDQVHSRRMDTLHEWTSPWMDGRTPWMDRSLGGGTASKTGLDHMFRLAKIHHTQSATSCIQWMRHMWGVGVSSAHT